MKTRLEDRIFAAILINPRDYWKLEMHAMFTDPRDQRIWKAMQMCQKRWQVIDFINLTSNLIDQCQMEKVPNIADEVGAMIVRLSIALDDVSQKAQARAVFDEWCQNQRKVKRNRAKCRILRGRR